LSELYAGFYLAELLGDLTDDYDPHPELFDLAEQALGALSAGEPAAAWVLRFELGALRLLGHLPSLAECVECGTAVEPAPRVPFGQLDGGVLCGRCRVGKKQVAMVSGGVLRMMAKMAEPDNRAWKRLDIDARSRGELRGLLNHYLCNLLGHRPRMHGWLGSGAGGRGPGI
jgi:DNA repair protein RecO (recombination protein O)